MQDSEKEFEHLYEKGWVIRNFNTNDILHEICEELAVRCSDLRPQYTMHNLDASFTNRADQLHIQQKLTDFLVQQQAGHRLFASEKSFLRSLLGPDLYIQTIPHLRIQKPHCVSDSPGKHRDTFYGNAVEHLNFWVPFVELQPNCGLLVVEGSHREASTNIKSVEYEDMERKQVTRGSVANQLGFLYSPKVDDKIQSLQPEQSKILSPSFGQYICFFGQTIHEGVNFSDQLRISFDLRFTHPHHDSKVKESYFEHFETGVVSRVRREFLNLSTP